MIGRPSPPWKGNGRRMKMWRGCVLSLVLGLSLVACAKWKSLSGDLPVPPKIEAPKLELATTDRPMQVPAGWPWISLQDPEDATVALGLTQRAWDSLQLYMEALRQGYCEGRYALERANGKEPERMTLCEPVGP